ncbi:MAG TPA: hypothetical protein ENH31_00340 [Nitrospirae bacterium]|nr:hypothetical protein [Nitrospirota bacterium]HDK17145.1 hypothetical protein [Nitrospirota bacterium]HDK81000.1 hypothetical protein [Nitrospirota bacterium]
METFDAGSTIVLEVEFEKYVPYGALQKFDPYNYPDITVTDNLGTDKVDAVALVRSDTGEWSLIVQTETDWLTGVYAVKVTATDGTYNDVTTDLASFKLR